MTGYPWTAWLWWIGGTALSVTGVVLLWWALFADGSRGRRRCSKCWYDMSGTEGLRCSECGHLATRERKLFTTRRRWRWVMVALFVLMLAGGGSLTPKVQRDGWWSLVSNTMLIRGLPLAWSFDDFWCSELYERMWRDRLTAGEWDRFFNRAVTGDWRAPSLSQAWKRKYGKMIQEWRNRRFQMGPGNAEHAQDKLYELPPEIRLAIRDTWPANLPLVFQVYYENWWPYGAGRRVHITPRIDGAERLTVHGNGDMLTIAPQVAGPIQVVFDLSIERKHHDSPEPYDEGWESVGNTVIPVSLRVQGSAEDLIEPVRYKQIDDLFRNGNLITIGRDLESTAYHQLDLRPTANAAFDGIAFGVVVEFMRDGDVIASKNWWWLGGQGEAGSHEPMHGDITRLLDAGDDATLSMRIRGDPEIAIRVLDADKYWAGEVTIPLTIMDR